MLLLVLALAAWVRLTHIDSGMSFDELWHLASTQGIGSAMAYYKHDIVYHDAIRLTSLEHEQNLWHVWNGMDGILHPPLFIVALRLWREVFGQSDFAAHGYPIFCSLVMIGFVFDSARLAMNRIAATLAGIALSVSMTQVYLAQEVRAYAMLGALGAIALWIMTRIEVLGVTRRRVIGLASLTLPMMLSHYFAFGACIAVGIYGLTVCKPYRKQMLAWLALSAAIYAIIWLPFAMRQLKDLGTGDAFLKLDRGPLHVVLLAASIPFRLFVDRDYDIERVPLLSCLLFIAPWFLIRRMPALRPWSLWLCAVVLPLVVLDLSRTTVHLAYIRYTAIASAAAPLLFIGTVWAMGYRRVSYFIGGIVGMAGGIYLYSDAPMLFDAENLTEVNRVLEPKYQKGDAVIVAAGVLSPFYCDALALTVSHSEKIFPTTLVVATKPLTPQMVRDLGTRSVWIACGDLNMPAEQYVPGGRVVYSYPASPFVRVWHLMIDDPDASPIAESASTTQPAGESTPH